MTESYFYERLLSLPEIKVDRVETHSKRIDIYCHSESGSAICPVCQKPTSITNQSYHREIRDLDISGKEVWLHISERQFVCIPCNRYFMEKFDWVDPQKSYTKRQAKWIFDLCAKQPFSEVGALVNMCHKTVERLYYSEAESQLKLKERYAQVRKLGIDELAHRKGKKDYCCVLTDLDRGIQLDILPDRKKETLIAHFQSLGLEFCQQIEVVSCDIWEPYILVARACFPQAKIVIDYFHVVRALNEALDSYRKSLRHKAPEVDSFKKLKWILFKRSDQCSDAEKQILQNAFDHSTELEEMYQLRNSFHHTFEFCNTKEQARRHIEQWLEDARFLQNKHWNKFLKTLSNWMDYILNYVELRITNAVTEGLNNVIRYLKRISFAIPNFEHMRIRVLANSG